MKNFIKKSLRKVVLPATLGLGLAFSMACGEEFETDIQAVSGEKADDASGCVDTEIPSNQDACYGQCEKDCQSGWLKLNQDRSTWRQDPKNAGIKRAPCYCKTDYSDIGVGGTDGINDPYDGSAKDPFVIRGLKVIGKGMACVPYTNINSKNMIIDSKGIIEDCDVGLKCKIDTRISNFQMTEGTCE